MLRFLALLGMTRKNHLNFDADDSDEIAAIRQAQGDNLIKIWS